MFEVSEPNDRHSEGKAEPTPEGEERHPDVTPMDPPPPQQLEQGAGGDRSDDQADSVRSYVGEDLTLQDHEAHSTRGAPHEDMTDGGRDTLRLTFVADRFLENRTNNSKQRLAQHLNHEFEQKLDI